MPEQKKRRQSTRRKVRVTDLKTSKAEAETRGGSVGDEAGTLKGLLQPGSLSIKSVK